MAGGIGRGLGAYDEMVWRSMVRDGSHFWDVVGLESEGTATDFQTATNSYLYGARFMTYLAYVHGPEKVIEWTARRPGSKAYYSSQFKHVFGVSLHRGVAQLDRVRARLATREPRGDSPAPDHPDARPIADRAGLGLARLHRP